MIDLSIDSGSLNGALKKIHQFVDRLFWDPMTVGKIFGSRKLDSLCQEVGKVNLESVRSDSKVNCFRENNVYIATKLQASGGHTVALLDVIRLSPKCLSLILVTETCGRSDRNEVKHKFAHLPEVVVEYAADGNHLEKLTWLQRRLLELRPKNVWLFNHHQDSVAIAAVQPDMGFRLNFFHHGDDRLCLGVFLDFADHFDCLPMVFHNCHELLGIINNKYLPLVVEDQISLPKPQKLSNAPLVTCTAAGSNKLEIDYFVKYVDVVGKILRCTGGRHVHFGRLSPWALRRIYSSLNKQGIDKNAFVYKPYVQSVWRALLEYEVDLYIASFPFGGGRTIVEVMGAGIPAVVHSHCCNRLIGGVDMVYDGAFSWREERELYNHLKNIDRHSLFSEGKMARQWYERYHRDSIAEKVLKFEGFLPEIPDKKPEYYPEPILQVLHEFRGIGLSRALGQKLWECYHRIRFCWDIGFW